MTSLANMRSPLLLASQLKRQGDPLKKFAPPDEEDFAGTSGKERIASVMLGLWRPLRTDLDAKELRAVLRNSKQGNAPEDRVYQRSGTKKSPTMQRIAGAAHNKSGRLDLNQRPPAPE